MNKLYDKYPVSKKRAKPCLHPVVQLVVNEYNAAHREKCKVNWSALTINAVLPLCQQQAAQNPKWHPDISSSSLNTYFEKLGPSWLWWNFPPEPAPLADDGVHMTFISLCVSCLMSTASMADPEPSPMPALVPPLPSTSLPVCPHRPAKGKEPEVLVDTLPHLKAKESGPLGVTEQHVPSPASAGPQDVHQSSLRCRWSIPCLSRGLRICKHALRALPSVK